jgi:hypothetical protein
VEYFLLILLVVVVSVIWQRVQHIRDMRLKAALTNFVNKIVPCKVEQREGQYYIYSALTQKFIAQGRTPKEVHNNLPNDEKFYLSFDGHREILEELEDIDLRNKSMIQ